MITDSYNLQILSNTSEQLATEIVSQVAIGGFAQDPTEEGGLTFGCNFVQGTLRPQV